MRVPNQELMAAVTREALSRGAQARLTVAGGSMRPFVPDGATVVIAPYGEARVRRGDIALAERSDGTYLLHRVVRMDGAQVWLLGDAQERPEGPFSRNQLWGRVILLQHGDRTVSLESPKWRATGLLWLALRPWRRPLWRLQAMARRLCRALRKSARARLRQAASSEFRLLLCCARVHLSEEAARRARELLAGPLDWETLLQQAEDHGLAPLLYRNLSALAPDRVPAAVLERLHAEYHANARRSLALLAEAARVLPGLEAAGLEALPLKGPLVADLVYGDVALRECSDLDLLVAPEDVARAEQALLPLGYRPEERVVLNAAQTRALLAFGQHTRLLREEGQAPLELHWRPASFAFLPRVPPLAYWGRDHTTPFGNAQLRFPAPEGLLVLLCLHGYKHLFYSLKWVCDIAELARTHPDLNYAQSLAQAAELGAPRAVLVGCLLAAELLEAPITPDPLAQARADRATMQIAEEITRRLRSGYHPPYRHADSARNLGLHLQGTDGWRARACFYLRAKTPRSARAILLLHLPGPLLGFYWAAGPVGFLQRRGAAALALSRRAFGWLWSWSASVR